MVNNHIFWFIGGFLELTCSFDKHLAYSLTECPSDINNAFIRISVKNVFGFSFAIVFYLGKHSCLQIAAVFLVSLVFSA